MDMASGVGMGLAVGMADCQTVYAALGSGKADPTAIRDLAQTLVSQAGLKYLLLAGTADPANPLCVPAWRVKARFYTEDYPCDEEMVGDAMYACPAGELTPNLAVGRLPARSVREMEKMVAKTLACHRANKVGPWMAQVDLLAGQAFFGPAMDALLEHLFSAVVNQTVPAHIDLNVTYANADSVYCPAPSEMMRHILGRFKAGPAALIFVGHGDYRGLSCMECDGFGYGLLDNFDALLGVRNPEGRTAVFVFACRTGCIDRNCLSLGEALLSNEHGPAAFFGSTRISQPYANAVLVSTLAEAIFNRSEQGTIGQMVLQLRQALLRNRPNSLRAMLDLPAMAKLGLSGPAQQREDAALEYVLLADPALPLRVALAGARVDAPSECAAGEKVSVTVRCPRVPSGQVTVSLVARHDMASGESRLGKVGRRDEAAMNRRYEQANAKPLAQAQGQLSEGVTQVQMTIPAALAAGEYGIGAMVCTEDQAVGGSTSIRVVAPAPTVPAEPAPTVDPSPRPASPPKPAKSVKFD